MLYLLKRKSLEAQQQQGFLYFGGDPVRSQFELFHGRFGAISQASDLNVNALDVLLLLAANRPVA